MASIREVARLSGVSVATVSRVLNGTATVREETRQRVLERVRELDYVPNAAARTLVRRRSQVIGVVVNTGDTHPDLKHPFFGDVLVGLRQALGASHYDLLLFTERQGFLRRAAQHQLDGLVLMGVDRRRVGRHDVRGAGITPHTEPVADLGGVHPGARDALLGPVELTGQVVGRGVVVGGRGHQRRSA